MAQSRPSDVEAEFHRRLKVAAKKIIVLAAGRQCGDCAYASLTADGGGECLQHTNIEGNPLKIHYAAAYACADHVPARSSV